MASSSVEVKKGDVDVLASDVPPPLRQRLGTEGTDGLLEVLERTREESVTTAISACTDRFERRLAYLAGRIPRKMYATASSPIEGLVGR